MKRYFFIGFSFFFLLAFFPVAFSDDFNNKKSIEALVKERFHSRWSALIEKDFEEAYKYESPAYREENDLESYSESYDPKVEWKAVELDKVEIEDNIKAVIAFSVSSVFNTDWGIPVENKSYHSEEWFLKDNEWWHMKKTFDIPHVALSPAKVLEEIRDDINGANKESTQGREDK